jgi:hypothetical protein
MIGLSYATKVRMTGVELSLSVDEMEGQFGPPCGGN